MKILNLYAGIGGNRKLWGNQHEITAVEHDPKIAQIYKDYFPKDTVLVEDAHQFLLKHYKEYDFIWSSPPCPTHSRARYAVAVGTDFEKYPDKQKPKYPAMELYQEIILLSEFFKGDWVVENVLTFYEPLITPQKIAKHYFWANFLIRPFAAADRAHDKGIKALEGRKGFELGSYSGVDKRYILRNCVEPELGLHVFNCALAPKPTQGVLL